MTYPPDASAEHQPLAIIKVGGDILLDESQRIGITKNILQLKENNWDVAILHGGGPQVSAMQARCGI